MLEGGTHGGTARRLSGARLNELAQLVNVSAYHLNRVLSPEVGMPPTRAVAALPASAR
jgi:AraC-like DNA-binding protein